MERPVCYDVTRLLTRIVNSTPNGIDRVDHALAQHFLAADGAFGCIGAGAGPRLLSGRGAAEMVGAIAAHWGEDASDAARDPVFRATASRLAGPSAEGGRIRRSAVPSRPRVSASGVVGWAVRHAGALATTPRRALPASSIYFNTSQFPLWLEWPFRWLEARRDVRAVFFVHDLLPLEMPEYFRRAELERHRRRMANVARFATAAVVTTRTVATALDDHLAGLGRRDLPVFVAPTPIAPVFRTPRVVEAALAGHPFFVLCSTLEPRKNHLMILAVWRALARRMGCATPKLVLVGSRGWHYDAILDLIERSPALRAHVIEVGGLSTPGLKRLIDNAQAVLMPSFGEGYGLPVHEALAAGAPVIAADIPAFREIAADDLRLLSPLDGEAWLDEIERRTATPRPATEAPRRPAGEEWAAYFTALEAFLAAL